MNKRGFTLIELLIVIAVIAILVAILLPQLRSFRTEARIARAQSDLDTLKKAILLYVSKTESLPDVLSSLTATGGGAVFDLNTRLISKIPNDPFTYPESAYSYTVYTLATDPYSGFNNFVVYSIGPDASGNLAWADSGGTINLQGGDDLVATEAKIQQ